MKKLAKVILTVVALVPMGLSATNGFLQIGYGVKSKGMGGIGIAYSQDSFASALNPAGLVHIGCRADVGAHWLKQKTNFTSEGPGSFFDRRSDEDLWWPEIGVNWMIDCDQSFGIATYFAGQSRVHYNGAIFNNDVNPGQLDLAHIFVTPSWSWQYCISQSFGAALNIDFSRLKVQGFETLALTSIDPTRVTNNGDDWELGLSVRFGWMWQVIECLRLGATYQTKTWVGHYHKYRGLLPNRGQADLPSQFGVGLAYMPRCNVVIAFDIVRYDWRDGKWFENTNFTNGGQQNGLGANAGAGLGWNQQMVYKVGLAWDVTTRLTLRGGFNYANSVTPAGNFLSILVPETVTQHVTFGGTYSWCDNELSAVYIHGREHDVRGFLNADRTTSQSIRSWQRSFGISYGRLF